MGRVADDVIGRSYLTIAEQWPRMAEGIDSSLTVPVDAAILGQPREALFTPLEQE